MGHETVFYDELRPDEFAERVRRCPIAYLPLGTLEWHGRHLPLGADGLQARGVFELLAGRVGGVVMPMLFLGPDCKQIEPDGTAYFGMDTLSFEQGHFQPLIGSAYHIDEDLFTALLDTIVRNLARAGFRAVIGHGHGPSNDTFSRLAPEFGAKHGLHLFTMYDLSGRRDERGLMTDHAAYNETSLVMALRPELVDRDAIRRDPVPTGIWGRSPWDASESTGKEIIDANVDVMVKKLEDLNATLPKSAIHDTYHHVKHLIQ